LPKVIYLTGAPAAGKSSTTRILLQRVPELLVWEYGARLTAHVREGDAEVTDQDELRSRSAELVTPEHVAEVDAALLAFVKNNRPHRHVLIDSHPVTKEAYGYRITPFSLEQFSVLAPDEIWVFYADPVETRDRIRRESGGRPLVSEEEGRMHTMLQASVAATYGMSVRCPVYMFDTAGEREPLVDRLVGRLE
jgi:adenylate kinase